MATNVGGLDGKAEMDQMSRVGEGGRSPVDVLKALFERLQKIGPDADLDSTTTEKLSRGRGFTRMS